MGLLMVEVMRLWNSTISLLANLLQLLTLSLARPEEIMIMIDWKYYPPHISNCGLIVIRLVNSHHGICRCGLYCIRITKRV